MRKRKTVQPARPQTRAADAAYPSPTERQRIIRRREIVLEKVIRAFVGYPDDPSRIGALIARYGPQDVFSTLDRMQRRTAETNLINDEATVYRAYRHAFARFGGERRFLRRQEYDELSYEQLLLYGQRKLKSMIPRPPGRRERELQDLLLLGVEFWEDITPPAVPPRPPDCIAPAPGRYGYPARALLEWGTDLGQERGAENARNVTKWRPAIPDLVRMATDEGLQEGWPGEEASWAPYHALHLLGYLRAHQAAGPLLALLGRENDWLSDQLPAAWGRMGSAAAPALWEYAGASSHPPRDRGTVYLGLAQLAVEHPQCRAEVISGLVRLLREGTAADAEANAYLVHVLDRLEAVEARDATVEAFRQGKVDRKIMGPADVVYLDEDTLAALHADRFNSTGGM